MSYLTPTAQAVIDALRTTLDTARGATTFLSELENRLRLGTMINGRVQSPEEAQAFQEALFDFLRQQALPKFKVRKPNDSLRILDLLKQYGQTQLESERPALEAARNALFPPPAPADWEEIALLRRVAAQHPATCQVGPPIDSAYFAKELEDDRLPLPDELLAVYAACDGFDLSCIAAPHLPAFSLLPAASIDISEKSGSYPRRPVVFQGGDGVQLSLFRDKAKSWWLVYEYDSEPVAKKALDLPALLRFGLDRMNAGSAEALEEALSWERYFGT